MAPADGQLILFEYVFGSELRRSEARREMREREIVAVLKWTVNGAVQPVQSYIF